MPKVEYEGITFDSEEEYQFYLYLQELENEKLIFDIKHQVNRELIPKVDGTDGKKKKSLLRNLSYTSDFEFQWNQKAFDLGIVSKYPYVGKIFTANQIGSIVDVKGKFVARNNNSGITFPVIQKVMMSRLNLYVQKIVPEDLFRATFLPKPLWKTKTGKNKTWHFVKRTLKDYLNV